VSAPAPPPGLRLDKWLWAARFFKTRGLAAQAVSGGHVHVDGQRVKPARRIAPGATLVIRRGAVEWEVTVLALNDQRRPAAEAARLYEETPASRARRESEAERARARALRFAHGLGRPGRQARRQASELKRGSGVDD
jgi:ribosome-associated heat shock protein Hsp15